MWTIVALTFALCSGHTKSQILPCNSTERFLFHCNDNNTCIDKFGSFCNGNDALCPDGSDEFKYNASLESERGIECQVIRNPPSKRSCHLPHRYVCDKELDCIGGTDECNCSHTFQCDGQCIVKSGFCDGAPNCDDRSDERQYHRTSDAGFQCPVTKLRETNVCVLPDQYVCDGYPDCDHGIDECFCDFTSGQSHGRYDRESRSNGECFRCEDDSLIIPKRQQCDGVVHCTDLSDECSIECDKKKDHELPGVCNSRCTGIECNCTGNLVCAPPGHNTKERCLKETSICDRRFDCANGWDENFCPNEEQFFKCYDKKLIIQKTLLCDGIPDCEDSSDELNCGSLTDFICNTYRVFFPHITDWDNNTQTASVHPPPGRRVSKDYPLRAVQCDGIPTCGGLGDECSASRCAESQPEFCKFQTREGKGFRCKNSATILIGREVCDGVPTCDKFHSELSVDELFCPNRFYCADRGANRLPIHIPQSGRCDWIQDCADMSDEMGCSNGTHFYCRRGTRRTFIKANEVCDGINDCDSGLDESQNCSTTYKSACKRLTHSLTVWSVMLLIVGFSDAN